MSASVSRFRVLSSGVTLAIGILIGWALAGSGGRSVRANGAGDRWGDWIVTTGVVHQETSMALKGVVPQEAIYYLNYKTGVLLASLPTPHTTARGTEFLSDFAERDLATDFGLTAADAPHFLMTTASVGQRSEGWDPLFVFETSTGQVATYRVQTLVTTTSNKPIFQLLDKRADPRLGRGVKAK
jgi:hypothetical protein